MKNLSIIFHSDSYDKVNHGLSIALSALLMGGKARLYFTHGALKYLKKKRNADMQIDEGDDYFKERYIKNVEEGHIERIEEMIKNCKEFGAEFFVCPASMALLNISRDELVDEVDKITGLASFIAESEDFDFIFI